MTSVFEQIFLGTREEAYDEIISGYGKQGRYVVSFLYFANVMKGRLLELPVQEWQKDYKVAIKNSDILLADGIALQLFYRRGAVGRRQKKTPQNLNGTDFNPWFLQEILTRSDAVHIGLYTLYDERIGKPASYIETVKKSFENTFDKSIDFVFQAAYLERMETLFPFDEYKKSIESHNFEYHVLLMSIGTPAQEIWVEKHRQQLQALGVLVINAGGTIDYISGFEQRGPAWVVKARVLETPWRIMQHPKKNFKKFAAMFGILRYRWSVLSGSKK